MRSAYRTEYYYYLLFIHFGLWLKGCVSGFNGLRHTPVARDIMQHASGVIRTLSEIQTTRHPSGQKQHDFTREKTEITIENDGKMSTFVILSYTAKPIPKKQIIQ